MGLRSSKILCYRIYSGNSYKDSYLTSLTLAEAIAHDCMDGEPLPGVRYIESSVLTMASKSNIHAIHSVS